MSFDISKIFTKFFPTGSAISSALCRALPRRLPLTLRLAVLHCYAVLQQSSFALLFLVGLNIFLPLVSNMVFLDQLMLFVILLPGMLAIVYAQALQTSHHVREIPSPFQLPISHTGRFAAFQFSLLLYWLLAIAVIALSVLLGLVIDSLFRDALKDLSRDILGRGTVHEVYNGEGTWVFLQKLLYVLLAANVLVNFACVIGAVSRRYVVFKGLAALVLIVLGLVLYVRHYVINTAYAGYTNVTFMNWDAGYGPGLAEWARIILADLVLLGLYFFAFKRIKIY